MFAKNSDRPPDELAGLSCEDGVESRIVREAGGKTPWEVTWGPQREADFAELPEQGWTLLVQEINRWVPDAALLLDVLLGRENTLLGAEELMGIPGGEGSEVMLRELDCDVRSLRRKLENTGAGSIEVLPGFRYRLKSGR